MELELYVVQNQDGQFFRAKGYGGYGSTWVDDIQKAKIYPKLSQARSRVTWFYNNYPKYGVPNIIKLTVSKSEVLHETERVMKAKKAKEVRKERAGIRAAKQEIRYAEQELQRAEERLARAKRKTQFAQELQRAEERLARAKRKTQ